jgi:hypothetical protein
MPGRMRGSAVLAAVLALASVVSPAPGQPAENPTPPDVRMMEAQALLADRRPGEIARRAERDLTKLLEDPEKADRAVLVKLSTLRQFGRLVSRAGRLEGPEREAAAWLLARPKLLTTVMAAVSPADSPDGVLGVITRLHFDHGEKPADFPDLTAALAVTNDSALDMSAEDATRPDPARASRLFAYFTNARAKMRYDPADLPWQLAVWVVDVQVTEDEMVWALGRYSTRQPLKDAFFDVRYELNPTYTASARPRQRNPNEPPPLLTQRYPQLGSGEGFAGLPTLEQLARSGGPTIAQAHFGTTVNRCMGVPSVALVGQGESGAVRAWLGVLEARGGRAVWDMETGRLDEFDKFPGSTLDPQNHENIGEDEVALLAELSSIKPEDRLASSALASLGVVTESRGRLQASLVPAEQRVKLLLMATEINPGNRQAWASLRAMGVEGQFTEADVDRVLAVLGNGLARRYPTMAFEILRDVISWRGSREQLATLTDAAPMFAARPDLVMRMHVLRGDLLKESGKPVEALREWGLVLDRVTDAGPHAVDAMRKIDQLLREQKEGQVLLDTYKRIWQRIPVPGPTGNVEATAYYQIGEAYATALEESGRGNEANNIRQRLESLRNANTYTPRPGR